MNLNDWLINICKERPSNKLVSNYEFGLFESSGEYTIYLVGINKYRNGDTSFKHIDFKPLNMYYTISQNEYTNINSDELQNKVFLQLKEFTRTEQFKTSFFVKAEKIAFRSNGQTIWSKSQR